MLKNLLNKAKDLAAQVATPENIAKAREIAASSVANVTTAATRATEKVQEHMQSKAHALARKHAQEVVRGHVNDAIDSITQVRRGSELVDCTTSIMVQKLRTATATNQLTLAGVPMDPADEQQHVLLCGAPGTGKSVEIKKMLRTIRQRGERAVVYDVSGELVSLYYRPGIDHILNPLDQRGERWNPWMDAESFEYAALAKSLIPDAKGQADPFWSEAGRATLEALLMQSRDLDELVSTGLSAPLGELAAMVRDAGFEGMIGPEKTFQSTRSTLGVYLRSLALLENVRRDDASAFSIRRWLENEDGSWLFLSVPSRGREALRPLVSMWLDTVVRQAMGLRPDPDRRNWLALDELPSLNKIPSLAPALAEGRKFGLASLIGVQAFGQLQESYGDKLAAALWGLPKTRLYLRIADAETAEHISKELGDQQLRRETSSSSDSTSTSTSSGGGAAPGSSSSSTSSSTNEQIVIERTVLPSQIAGLPDLVGYLRTGGSHMVARVKVDFDGLPRRGEQDEFIAKPQRPLPRYRPNAEAPLATPLATPWAGEGSEATPAQEPGDSTHDQEQTMEAMMREYEDAVQIEVAKFIAEYGQEFISNLDDEDIEAFSAIFAERVDMMMQSAGVEEG